MKVEFGNLELGERFYDPLSGDWWIKVSENVASLDNDVQNKVDTFFLDDEVIV